MNTTSDFYRSNSLIQRILCVLWNCAENHIFGGKLILNLNLNGSHHQHWTLKQKCIWNRVNRVNNMKVIFTKLKNPTVSPHFIFQLLRRKWCFIGHWISTLTLYSWYKTLNGQTLSSFVHYGSYGQNKIQTRYGSNILDWCIFPNKKWKLDACISITVWNLSVREKQISFKPYYMLFGWQHDVWTQW